MLLLHGFDSSLLEFRSFLPLLAGQHEVWAVDWLGFGFTERPPNVAVNPITIRQHLYATWQQLMHQPMILVGASLGGAVAIDFALAYPQCVSKLVLIDSVGFSGSFPIGQWLFPPIDYVAARWLAVRKQVALQVLMASKNPDLKLIDTVRCSLLHQTMPGWHESIISFTKCGGYANLNQRIAQLHPPTLILWGEQDDVLGLEDASKFQQAIARSQLFWIKQAGHVPHLEQPHATAEALLSFIS
ncbi:MAG: alpha/beta fold hydrolase [Leptolyngbya sp. BL-A-14]